MINPHLRPPPPVPRPARGPVVICLLLLSIWPITAAHAQTLIHLPDFNFPHPAEASRWHALHDLAPLEFTTHGLVARITGSDPYLPHRITPPTPNYGSDSA